MVLKKFCFEKQSCQMGPGLIIILSEKARTEHPSRPDSPGLLAVFWLLSFSDPFI
jgi:hypothetical protein